MAMCFKTCLLIDDNYIDNFVTRKILEGSNFVDEIIVVRSATEAIEALSNGSIKPDVIFLDVRMPLMGGFEFLDEYDKIDIDKTVQDLSTGKISNLYINLQMWCK